jgi:two-component system sensor histidine kinase EvgS
VDGGADAIAAAAATRFDAILMDCRMPGVDGFTAARAIRAGSVAGEPPMPILAVTANALPEDRARCRDAGMDSVVAKPVALADLRAALARHGVLTAS